MALSVVGATAVSPASVWTVCGWCVWAAGVGLWHVGSARERKLGARILPKQLALINFF